MTDSELISKITKDVIIPFIENLEDGEIWEVDNVFDAWEMVYHLFMKHRPELKEIETKKKKEEKNLRKQELEEQLLQIQKELKTLSEDN